MHHIYSKLIEDEKKRVLRLERQEYPNNPLHDAVEQMLSRVLGGGVGVVRKELSVSGGLRR